MKQAGDWGFCSALSFVANGLRTVKYRRGMCIVLIKIRSGIGDCIFQPRTKLLWFSREYRRSSNFFSVEGYPKQWTFFWLICSWKVLAERKKNIVVDLNSAHLSHYLPCPWMKNDLSLTSSSNLTLVFTFISWVAMSIDEERFKPS